MAQRSASSGERAGNSLGMLSRQRLFQMLGEYSTDSDSAGDRKYHNEK